MHIHQKLHWEKKKKKVKSKNQIKNNNKAEANYRKENSNLQTIIKQSNKLLLNWTSRSTGTTSSLGNRWTFSVACFSDTNASSKVKLVFAVTLHVQILWRYKFIRFKYSLQYIRLQIRSKAKWWDKNTNTNSIIHQQNPSNNNFQFSEKWKENNTHNPWKSLW